MMRFRTRPLPSLSGLRADESTTPTHRGLIVGGLLVAGVGLLWLARDPFGAGKLGGLRPTYVVYRGKGKPPKFFTSRKKAEDWTEEHPGSKIVRRGGKPKHGVTFDPFGKSGKRHFGTCGRYRCKFR